MFDAPSSATSHLMIQPPLCKSKSLRKTTFNLLLELCRSCDENVKQISNICLPKHVLFDPDIMNNTSNKYQNGNNSGTSSSKSSSNFNNYNGAKSQTGFVGLRNLCCTCYMNATNQNLFMSKLWRRAVLAIDLKCSNPKESMIYQTQRMYAYLQESEKQYYDPEGFCHTYKDPDDPSKPINPRVQQDASAYYGRLLHSIKDAVVNTKHENILDVFNIYKKGEKIAKGSDGHQYSSSRDEPPEQYLSVDVRGVKSLNQSLAKQFEGNDVDFKWDKHDSETNEKEELLTRKRSTIQKLPPCLPIHLKRFDLDYTTFQTIKLNERFEFPLEINLFPYTLEGRAYYDTRGGSPIVTSGSRSHTSNHSIDSTTTTIEQTDESKISSLAAVSNAGGKTNDPDQNDNQNDNTMNDNNVHEGDIDLMFVPVDAPHPPEYYQYDLCGITIHTGTADGGHYFSYIKERDEDMVVYVNNEDDDDDDAMNKEGKEGKEGKDGKDGKDGKANKTNDSTRSMKNDSYNTIQKIQVGKNWCEFNDRTVSAWNIDRVDEDCFGGEGTRTHKHYQTGKVTTSKFEKRQNAFMLFYERKKTTLIVNTSSSNGTRREKNQQKVKKRSSQNETKEELEYPKVIEAATKMKESLSHGGIASSFSSSTSKAQSMPIELYDEIWGQNMVSWKKRNLLDLQYSEFMQNIIGLTINSAECQEEQLKLGTMYMLATLIHLPRVENSVLRDWRSKLGKGFTKNSSAAQWLLQLILTPTDEEKDNSNKLYDIIIHRITKETEATRLLVREAMSAISSTSERSMISNMNSTQIQHELQLLDDSTQLKTRGPSESKTAASSSAGASAGIRKVAASSFSSKMQVEDADTEVLISAVPISAQFILKMVNVVYQNCSRNWPFEILVDFVQRSNVECQFVLRTGLLHHLCLQLPLKQNERMGNNGRNGRNTKNLSYSGKQLLALLFQASTTPSKGNSPRSTNTNDTHPVSMDVLTLLENVNFVEYISSQSFYIQEENKSSDGDGNVNAFQTKSSEMIVMEHLCWNNEKMLNIINQWLLLTFDRCGYWHLENIYNFVRCLFTIQDDLYEERVSSFVNIVLESINATKQQYRRVTSFHMYAFMTLVCNDSIVEKTLMQHTLVKDQNVLEKYVKWCDTNSENNSLDEFRDSSVQHPEKDLPWDLIARECIVALMNGTKCQMTGFDTHKDDPTSLIGRRISVYWAGSSQAYEGMITKYSSKTMKFEVHYDDNDYKDYSLYSKRAWRLLGLDQVRRDDCEASLAVARGEGRTRQAANPSNGRSHNSNSSRGGGRGNYDLNGYGNVTSEMYY